MKVELRTAVEKGFADYRRIGGNYLLDCIPDEIVKYFGPMAVFIKDTAIKDPIFFDCYVKDFLNHDGEKKSLKYMEQIFYNDMNFYKDMQKLITGDINYLHGLLKNADEFDPLSWEDPYFPRILCGSKGCGKTTLMLFTKAKLEYDSYKLIYIRLASPVGGVTTPWQYIRSKIIHQIEETINDLATKNAEPLDKVVLERFNSYWITQSLLPEKGDTQKEKEEKRSERRQFLAKLSRSKHTYEFTPYLRESIKYIRNRFNIDVIIFVDDVDRLENAEKAKIVCDRVKALARDLGDVPCVVSAREETLALLSDTDPMFIKLTIAPPQF